MKPEEKETTGKKAYLFFDTETTGLPKSWREPTSNVGNWPHVVQIAWVQCDETGACETLKDYIIRPEGFVIPESASKIHGITTERALAEGRPLGEVLGEFLEAVRTSAVGVAHNLDFDEKVIEVEFLRKGMPPGLREMEKLCTMKTTTNYCAIPGPYGNKWPKLSELHIKLFGVDFEDQHNAASDVLCCVKCFFELKKRGIL
ncbi:MAG TPA: 3'-5' exonuclease [Candidatus Omnitrophota bacterium]|nr:3'-5' exonuclease [Candidatus Omnitrophota bacterium]HPS37742.1 3'-5' exonuclease [Candidatus Omnitrophota bacterium]